ncbi:MAG: hypothetical protein AB7T22_02860 [Calditrichaceae bacterium]
MAKKNHFLLWLLIVLVNPAIKQLNAQTRLNFDEYDSSSLVDYSSFYPLMLLKFEYSPFYKVYKNPVLDISPRNWDGQDAADPFVLVTADSVTMYYDGDNHSGYGIGYAVLDSSGWFWQKRNNLDITSGNDWDAYHSVGPSIVNDGSRLLMFYSGNSKDSELGYQIGAAEKSRLGKWIHQGGDPVLELKDDFWDFAGNAYADVVYMPDQKTFRMWYTGFGNLFTGIGQAVSNDGIHWKKENEKNVFEIAPGVIAPDVVFDGESYRMFFTRLYIENGLKTKICMAESVDGTDWKNVQDVLIPSERWEGRRLMKPNISFYDGKLHLFYCGQNGSTWRIGEAVAEAIFEKEGEWISPLIRGDYKNLVLQFETPPETSVSIEIVGENEKLITRLTSPFANVEVLRNGAGKSMIPLNIPEDTDFRIKLKLSTASQNRSPVIYDLYLVP